MGALPITIVEEGLANLMWWYDSKTGYLLRTDPRPRLRHRARSRGTGSVTTCGAVREGQETAETAGVNSTAVAGHGPVGRALAALCGAFFVHNFRADPGMVMSLDTSMKFVLVTILGGGTLAGPLGRRCSSPCRSSAGQGGLGGGVDLIIFGALIIVIVVKQPAGITGIVRDIARRFGRKPAAGKRRCLPWRCLRYGTSTRNSGARCQRPRELHRRGRGHRGPHRPNGGKTTLFNCVSGLYPVTAGKIFFDGRETSGAPSYRIARMGAVRTFQVVRPLKEMSVFDNVLVGAFLQGAEALRPARRPQAASGSAAFRSLPTRPGRVYRRQEALELGPRAGPLRACCC